MIEVEAFLVLVFITFWAIAVIIFALMFSYEQNKPIGMQTVLDVLLLDWIFVNIAFYTYCNIYLLLGHFYHGLNQSAAIFAFAFGRYLLSWLIASSQIFLIVKSILIVHLDWIQDFPDKVVRKWARFGAFVYTIVLTVLDQQVVPNLNPGVDFLTGTKIEPVFGRPVGEVCGSLLLFASILYTKFKIADASVNTTTVVTSVFGCLYLVLNIILTNVFLYDAGVESIVYFFVISFEIVFGILVPCYLVYTTPSMKAFFAKTLSFSSDNRYSVKA